MKIIKHGNEKVLERVNQRFTCSRCGCEFIANWDEYEEVYIVKLGATCVRKHDCPECGCHCNLEVRYD